VFSDVFAWSPTGAARPVRIAHSDFGADTVEAALVSANFWDALGVRPAIGRAFRPDERQAAMLSWAYWQSHFNGDRSAVGQSLTVNDTPATIVGVLPRGFFGLQIGLHPAIWMPVPADGEPLVQIVARLKPDVTLAQAQAEVRLIDRARLEEREARSHDVQWRQATITLEPAGAGLSTIRDRFGSSVTLMTVVGGILLLITCINVASMLLARSAARRREVAVRMALGAGRWRLVRQMLTESLLLSSAASAIGLLIAYVGAHALVRFIASGRPPVGFPRLDIPVPLDVNVLLFACGAGIATGIAFGVVPAWRSFERQPSLQLRETGGSDSRRTARFGNALIIAQVALSIVLLNAAVIFVRYLSDLRTVGLGFRPDAVMQARLDWSPTHYTAAQMTAAKQQLLERILGMPTVRSATLAGMTPISGAAGSQFITVPGFEERADERRRVSLNVVAPRYFETLGTPLVAGRDFSADDAGRPGVAIVNEAVVRYYFGASNPIGRQFTVDGQRGSLEIVGVVADAKYWDLHETPPRTIYMNAFQNGLGGNLIVVRTDDAAAGAQIQRVVREVVPAMSAPAITTLSAQIDASILPERMITMLSAVFGIAAAVLVAIGLYGLLAYSVARRVKEIGIRIAIGATQGSVIRMVVLRAVGIVLVGLAVGAPIALTTKRYATAVLSIVAATQVDPVTLPTRGPGSLVAAGVAMAAVALAASYLPARRAARVDPMIALRAE
jgi:predicted permease